MVKEFWRPLNV